MDLETEREGPDRDYKNIYCWWSGMRELWTHYQIYALYRICCCLAENTHKSIRSLAIQFIAEGVVKCPWSCIISSSGATDSKFYIISASEVGTSLMSLISLISLTVSCQVTHGDQFFLANWVLALKSHCTDSHDGQK